MWVGRKNSVGNIGNFQVKYRAENADDNKMTLNKRQVEDQNWSNLYFIEVSSEACKSHIESIVPQSYKKA